MGLLLEICRIRNFVSKRKEKKDQYIYVYTAMRALFILAQILLGYYPRSLEQRPYFYQLMGSDYVNGAGKEHGKLSYIQSIKDLT